MKKLMILFAVTLLALLGCTSPVGPSLADLTQNNVADKPVISTKALMFAGVAGVPVTENARALTGVTNDRSGLMFKSNSGPNNYDEMVGRSATPLLTGMQNGVDVHDGDVFEYTVLGHIATVTVTATYDVDEVTVLDIIYTGLFDDGHSNFVVTLKSDGTFTAAQEILFRMEGVDGEALVYMYTKSNIFLGTFYEDGSFDADGYQTQIVSDSWVYYNLAGGGVMSPGTGSVLTQYVDYKVKSRAGGMSVLQYHYDNYRIEHGNLWVPLSFDNVADYHTWAIDAFNTGNAGYFLTNYLNSDSKWHMQAGDGPTLLANFNSFE